MWGDGAGGSETTCQMRFEFPAPPAYHSHAFGVSDLGHRPRRGRANFSPWRPATTVLRGSFWTWRQGSIPRRADPLRLAIGRFEGRAVVSVASFS
jgi:hypothetical protein